MGWLTIDVQDEIAETISQKAARCGQSVEAYLTELVCKAIATTEGTVEKSKQHPGKHPALAIKLLDEAASLRAQAREIERTPAPPPPGNDKTETFAKLWAEAWKRECGGVADRLGDAATVRPRMPPVLR